MNAIAFPKPSFKRTKDKIVKLKLQQEKECWVCSTTQALQSHHCFGAANRPVSEKYGLVVWLCRTDHTGGQGIHFNKGLMDRLHEFGKSEFVKVYGESEFLRIFRGRFI